MQEKNKQLEYPLVFKIIKYINTQFNDMYNTLNH